MMTQTLADTEEQKSMYGYMYLLNEKKMQRSKHCHELGVSGQYLVKYMFDDQSINNAATDFRKGLTRSRISAQTT